MRQNGYKFVKNRPIPRLTCQNTSKCTKTDIHFSKFSGGDTPGPPAGVRTQTQFKRTPLTKPWVRACTRADAPAGVAATDDQDTHSIVIKNEYNL